MLISIFSGTVLICLVLLIRYIFLGKVRAAAIYALWGLVLLRLLVPVQLFSIPTGVQEFISPPHSDVQDNIGKEEEHLVSYGYETNTIAGDEDMADQETISHNYEHLPAYNTDRDEWEGDGDFSEGISGTDVNAGKNIKGTAILFFIWAIVAAVLFVIILCANAHLYFKLRKERIVVQNEERPYIYSTHLFAVPCLYGLCHPSIYLNAEWDKGTLKEQQYIILHEKMHYCHLDHIWSVVRMLLVCLYWFNPLVWVAAKVSRLDAEYAVDEAVIRNFGKEERIRYGEAILNTLRSGKKKGGLLPVANAAGSSKKEIEKRLMRILGNRKTSVISLVVVAVVVLGLTACSFSGKQEAEKENRTEDITAEESGTEPVSGGAINGTDETVENKVLLERPLEDAVSDAIKDDFRAKMLLSSTRQYVKVLYKNVVEAHTVLAKEQTRDTVTVYLMMKVGCYGVGVTDKGHSEDYYGLQGGENGFRAITFKKKERENEIEYEMEKYWQPQEGEENKAAVRKKFPDYVEDEELDRQRYQNHLSAECHQKALAYLKEHEHAGTNKNALIKMDGEVEKVDIFISDGVVENCRVNENPEFVQTLVDAYKKIKLVPITNLKENALNVEESITLNFYVKGKETPIQVIFDANRIVWIYGRSAFVMDENVFDYKQIREFVYKRTGKGNQNGMADIVDYKNDMEIVVNLLDTNNALIAKFIKRRAKITSVNNGVSVQEQYDRELMRFERLKKQYLLAKDLGIAPTEKEAKEYIETLKSSGMWEEDTLKTYCKGLDIDEEQYWGYVKKWYMVTDFDYDRYMEIRNISEDKLSDHMQEDMENYMVRVIE